MFTIDNLNKIAIIEGDSGVLELGVDDYELREGDTVYFSVSATKTNDRSQSAYLFQKKITEFENGNCVIKINPEDTKGKVGNYYYDVQITLGNGFVDTVIAPTIFAIKGGITNE